MKRSKLHIPIILLVLFNSGYIQLAFSYNSDSHNLQLARSLYFKADSLSNISNFKAADSLLKIAETLFLEEDEHYFYTSCLIKHSKVMYGLGKAQNAEEYLKKVEDAFFKFGIAKNDTLYSNYLNRKGYYHIMRSELEKAKVAYLESANIREVKRIKDYSLSYAYNNLGYIFNNQGDLSNAKKYFDKSLEIRKKIYDSRDPRLARTYTTVGALLITMGRYEKALEHLTQANDIFLDTYGEDYFGLGNLYNNMGIIHFNTGNYSSAENYYLKAIQIFSNNPDKNINHLSSSYNNLGLIHYETDSLDLALDWFNRNVNIIKDKSPKDLDRVYIKIANTYKNLSYNDQAEEYFTLAVDNIVQFHGNQHPELATAYLNFGLFYTENGNFETGMRLYFEALDIYINKYGIKHPNTSRCYHNIAVAFREQSMHDSALYYIQKSLIAIVEDFNDENLNNNPSIHNTFSSLRLLSSLKIKADILIQQYGENGGNAECLKLAFSTLELSIDLIEKVRLEYISEESKLYLSKNEKETYDEIIEAAIVLYENTNIELYKEKAFIYSEKSKSAILLSSIRNIEAREFGDIPLEMLQEEDEIKHDLSIYKEYLFKEKQVENPNDAKVSLFENYVFRLSNKYDSIIREFERDFPEYYALKFDTKVVNSGEVAKTLRRNEAFIEYSISDTSLILFLITRDEFLVRRVTIDENFKQYVNNLQAGLMNNDFSRNIEKEYLSIVSSSYRLYQQLFGSFEEEINKKHLVIIPDGILAYLPFEILLTQEPDLKSKEYHSLPYLIKSHPIHYSYSATLLLENFANRKVYNKSLLAFAPQYENVNSIEVNQSYLRQANVSQLNPLPFSKQEVKSIQRITRGKIMLDDEATETNFKALASDYKILHLAMHTIIDNNSPMHSKMAFTASNQDSINDGFLNVHELYKLKLKAQLVVLSSCNSGSGKLQSGEGIMSLARGFMYAGCPSVVMTLWEVEDKSGAEIMERFYTYLKRGYSKNKAMRNAKLDFLENANTLKSHPYFWSSYIPLGDHSPVYTGFWTGKALPSSLMILLLVFIFLRKKNRKSI